MKKFLLVLVIMLVPMICFAKSADPLVKVGTQDGIEYYVDVNDYVVFDDGSVQLGMGTVDHNNGMRSVFMLMVDRGNMTYTMLNFLVITPSGETIAVPSKGEKLKYTDGSIVDKAVKIVLSHTGEKT